MGDNGNPDSHLRILPQNQFGWKSSAETTFHRKRDTGDSFKNGAFSGRLVTADDDLWKGDIVADALGSEGVDGIQKIQLLLSA